MYPMSGCSMSRFFYRLRRATSAFGLASLIAAGLAGTPAVAADDVFVVGGISVDETAATAAAARAAAFQLGQQAALAKLLRRLTQRTDHSRLPPVETERLEFMVQALEVANEKTSDVRYLADMTVAFKPDEVRRLLKEARIPFAETLSKPVLVLPVQRQGGELVLWDEPNLWREAWSQLPRSDGLVPLIVPVGDLSDISDIDAVQAADGDPLRLSAIAARYGASDVLVAIATPSETASGIRIDITASRVGAPSQPPILFNVQSADRGARPSLLRTAVDGIAAAVEDAWKSASIIEFDRPGLLVLAVPLTSLEQWVSVERRLKSIASISAVNLVSLTRDSAAVEITHFGDEAQLTTVLAQQDLALEQPPLFSTDSDPFRSVQSGQALQMRILRPLSP